MTGRMRREYVTNTVYCRFIDPPARLQCDEAPEEAPTISTENVLKIECNISIQTNYMEFGIKAVRMLRLFYLESLFNLLLP